MKPMNKVLVFELNLQRCCPSEAGWRLPACSCSSCLLLQAGHPTIAAVISWWIIPPCLSCPPSPSASFSQLGGLSTERATVLTPLTDFGKKDFLHFFLFFFSFYFSFIWWSLMEILWRIKSAGVIKSGTEITTVALTHKESSGEYREKLISP